jgi:hypothetical protein
MESQYYVRVPMHDSRWSVKRPAHYGATVQLFSTIRGVIPGDQLLALCRRIDW